MAPVPVESVALACHPRTPCAAVDGIVARVQRTTDGALEIAYVLEGDLDRLRVPPPRLAGPLWQHTCFESFIAHRGHSAYHEYNLAPSGEWAAYAYHRYRDGGALADQSSLPALDPRLVVRVAARRLELDARIPIARLADTYAGADLVLGLSAVVESRDGSLSYWALRHPPGRPDFHHAAAFALALAGAPRVSSGE